MYLEASTLKEAGSRSQEPQHPKSNGGAGPRFGGTCEYSVQRIQFSSPGFIHNDHRSLGNREGLLGPLRKRAVAARTVIVRGYWRLTNEHPGQQGDKPHPTHACHLRPPSTYQNRPLFVQAHSIWTINPNTCHFLFKQWDRGVVHLHLALSVSCTVHQRKCRENK